jgi:hypothetical protein
MKGEEEIGFSMPNQNVKQNITASVEAAFYKKCIGSKDGIEMTAIFFCGLMGISTLEIESKSDLRRLICFFNRNRGNLAVTFAGFLNFWMTKT